MGRPKLYPEGTLTVAHSMSLKAVAIIQEHARKGRVTKSRAVSAIIEDWEQLRGLEYSQRYPRKPNPRKPNK